MIMHKTKSQILKALGLLLVVIVISYILLLLKVVVCQRGCVKKYRLEKCVAIPGGCPVETCKDQCNRIGLPNLRDNTGSFSTHVWPPQEFGFSVISWSLFNLLR